MGRDSFVSAGKTMQRPSLTRNHQMELRAHLIQKRKRSEGSVESCSTLPIQLVQLLQKKPLLSEAMLAAALGFVTHLRKLLILCGLLTVERSLPVRCYLTHDSSS